MEKHNKNFQRIDNLIVNAYNTLIIEKGDADITITELCKVAKINRTTFYKHYRGIYEITDKLENELIYNVFNLTKANKLDFISFLKNPAPSFNQLNENIKNNREYYNRMLRAERIRYIIDKIDDAVIQSTQKNYPRYFKDKNTAIRFKINIAFFIGATVNLYLQWFRGYINLDLDEVSNQLVTIVKYASRELKL